MVMHTPGLNKPHYETLADYRKHHTDLLVTDSEGVVYAGEIGALWRNVDDQVFIQFVMGRLPNGELVQLELPLPEIVSIIPAFQNHALERVQAHG